jgi:hypothetical protein
MIRENTCSRLTPSFLLQAYPLALPAELAPEEWWIELAKLRACPL